MNISARYPKQVWRPSPTGCVFSAVFLAIAIWCLVAIAHGKGDPLWILSFLTLPVSYLVVLAGDQLNASFGISNDVLGWIEAVLDVLWGVSMFYFFGWLLERPLRR